MEVVPSDVSSVIISEEETQWEFAADKTFKKKTITNGTGFTCPRDGSVCRVRVKRSGRTAEGFLVQRSLHFRDGWKEMIEFVIGENDTELDDMLDKILQHMKPNETCLVSFNLHTDEQTGVRPVHSASSSLLPVELEMGLLSFQEVPELWELNPAQLVDAARHHKECGVRWYQSGQLLYALRRFARAMRALLVIDKEALEDVAKSNTDASDLLTEFRTLMCALYLNIAAIQLQSDNYKSVIENCTKALKLDPVNIKAYYRRGTAYSRIQEKVSAKEDLVNALKLAPNDADIRRELRSVLGTKTES